MWFISLWDHMTDIFNQTTIYWFPKLTEIIPSWDREIQIFSSKHKKVNDRTEQAYHGPALKRVIGTKLQACIGYNLNKCWRQSSIQPSKATIFNYFNQCRPHIWIHLNEEQCELGSIMPKNSSQIGVYAETNSKGGLIKFNIILLVY